MSVTCIIKMLVTSCTKYLFLKSKESVRWAKLRQLYEDNSTHVEPMQRL